MRLDRYIRPFLFGLILGQVASGRENSYIPVSQPPAGDGANGRTTEVYPETEVAEDQTASTSLSDSTTVPTGTVAPPFLPTSTSIESSTEPATETPTATEETETPVPTETSEYPWHENIMTTVFWVGEEASAANDYIDNKSSAWVTDWVGEFGGVDNPDRRNPDNPYLPESFTPKDQNWFYFALPVEEFNEIGLIAGVREQSPWADEAPTNGSLFKNRWIEVRRIGPDGKEYVAYGQWEDTGPGESDPEYVFGNGPVKNTFGLGAGLDISPSFAIALGFNGNTSNASGQVDWRFIDAEDVPDGPWKQKVTTSGPNW